MLFLLLVSREKIEDLEALRQAVKLEAVELETQLKQLAHHCDESLKMVTTQRLQTCTREVKEGQRRSVSCM